MISWQIRFPVLCLNCIFFFFFDVVSPALLEAARKFNVNDISSRVATGFSSGRKNGLFQIATVKNLDYCMGTDSSLIGRKVKEMWGT
ncbi:hypothetical protein GIB67_020678 [Kingdonia uniflora]|uniref:Uncharacterized protein n=1 Tax=Kingdonia uniflora TaxID=39325 RepID=A0A7J7NK94_9MAGN|nr:hypothetical protein GIB67_020678 [Kingdonia uniflora]